MNPSAYIQIQNQKKAFDCNQKSLPSSQNQAFQTHKKIQAITAHLDWLALVY